MWNFDFPWPNPYPIPTTAIILPADAITLETTLARKPSAFGGAALGLE
jgi:hypothetical protein